MNIVYFTQEIFVSLLKKAETYTQLNWFKNLVKAFPWKTDLKSWLLNLNSVDIKLRFKTAGTYLFDASIEGLKQNLFGPNINMEFLVLSMRALLILAVGFVVSFPKYISGRYAEKTNNEAICPDYDDANAPFKLCLR